MEKVTVKVSRVLYPRREDDAAKRAAGEKVFYILATSWNGTALTCNGDLRERPDEGLVLELSGEWETYNGMRQFRFKSYDLVIPESSQEMLAYVCELTTGVGPSAAMAIWEKYKEEWETVAERADLKFENIARFDAAKQSDFRAHYNSLKLNTARTKAVLWLKSHGATTNLAEAACDYAAEQKQGILQEVQADPYWLADVPNYGFKTVDTGIRQTFGIVDDDPRRFRACVLYAMGQLSQNGDTALPWNAIKEKLAEYIPEYPDALVKEIREMMDAGEVFGFNTRRIASRKDVEAERDILAFAREAAQ